MENGTISTELDGKNMRIAAFLVCTAIDGSSVLYNVEYQFSLS